MPGSRQFCTSAKSVSTAQFGLSIRTAARPNRSPRLCFAGSASPAPDRTRSICHLVTTSASASASGATRSAVITLPPHLLLRSHSSRSLDSRVWPLQRRPFSSSQDPKSDGDSTTFPSLDPLDRFDSNHPTSPSPFDISSVDAQSSTPVHPPPPLPSTIVEKYWSYVMRSSDPHDSAAADYHQPLLDDPLGQAPIGSIKGKSTTASDTVRLLAGAVRVGREGGDLYPTLLTRHSCDLYLGLKDDDARKLFLTTLGKEFGVKREAVLVHAEAYKNAIGKGDRAALRAEQQLREALVPQHTRFFNQVNSLPGGMKFLVDLREDLLRFIAEDPSPHLRTLNESLKTLLQSWFSLSHLDLERITWSTPASILEKIIQYEKVHPIPTWSHLKQRLGPNRLCYAFFHKGMPLEPLTFIQIALVEKIEWDVQRILGEEVYDSEGRVGADVTEKNCVTAIFYSISSSQRGLSGVDLGNFLIKRCVKEIQKHYPQIETFCTLSPIPGFRHWLTTEFKLLATSEQSSATTGDAAKSLLLPGEEAILREMVPSTDKPAWMILRDTIETAGWWKDSAMVLKLKTLMVRLCSRYMILEKKRRFALDPVANFHIRNGACLHRLNWMGDTSDKGMNQSYGIMVNYIYVLPLIEQNNQRYLLDGTIPVVEPVSSTLKWAVENGGGVRVVSKGPTDTESKL
ncbi:hypothetical protein HK101_011663 [Irineochytrium annulatum]|nr:hypothetical protein HK101_011663 [Irineochytrium annulatum]